MLHTVLSEMLNYKREHQNGVKLYYVHQEACREKQLGNPNFCSLESTTKM